MNPYAVINMKHYISTYQAHQHNDHSQFEVLHTHGSRQVTTCGLKRD